MDSLAAKASLLLGLASLDFTFPVEQFRHDYITRSDSLRSHAIQSVIRENDTQVGTGRETVSLEAVSLMGGGPGVAMEVPMSAFRIDDSLDKSLGAEALRLLQPFASLIGFKFSWGQPIMFVCVDADGLDRADAATIADRCEAAAIELTEISAKLGMGDVQGGAYVVLAFFYAISPPRRELASLQGKCKRHKFWKKTFVMPWCILSDLRAVVPHPGLPVFSYVLSAKVLSERMFSTAGSRG